MPEAILRSIPDCRSALADLLQVDVARLSIEPGTPAAHRRRSRSTRRDTVKIDGAASYSIKWYPAGHDRNPEEIAKLQTLLREQYAIRTPVVAGVVHVGSFSGLVEEWVGDLQTLAAALSTGAMRTEDGQSIIESVFRRLCSREFPDDGIREQDRARCLDALKWLGHDTDEFQAMRAWVESDLPPTPARTVVIHEDLIPQNVFIDESGQPLLVDFDFCRFSTIPWFAVWRNAHLTGSPRSFWPPEWNSTNPDFLFKMCSLLETQLQSDVLEYVQFVVDRDKGWIHHNHHLAQQLEDARRQQRSLDQAFEDQIASRIASTNETAFSNIRAQIEGIASSFRGAISDSHRQELEAERNCRAHLQSDWKEREHRLLEQIDELRQANLRMNSEKQTAEATIAEMRHEFTDRGEKMIRLHRKTVEEKDAAIVRLQDEVHQLERERESLAIQNASHAAESKRRDLRARRTAALMRGVLPLVSIVIVNRNGRKFLSGVLDALRSQTYPNLEIVFVDNGSSDDSLDYVSTHFPEVRLVRADRNLGFAGGNNLGASHAAGDYIAFLNNDTIPDEDWLAQLVQTAHANRDIGAVGSKILFLTRFIQVDLSVPAHQPAMAGSGTDERSLGVALDLSSRVSGCDYDKLIFSRGFYGEENWNGRKVRWSAPEATMLLPVPDEKTATLEFKFRGFGPEDHRQVCIRLPSGHVAQVQAQGEFTTFPIQLDSATLDSASYVINNAASRLDDHGNAGDRGIFEPDRGQYDTEEDVTSLCGCSMLIRKSLFSDMGGFDERYFMYYEDTDLSWRLRSAGLRLVYQPKSVVRHVHAGSSVEWSPFFRFHVVRNHRFIKAKNLPLMALRREISDRSRRLRALKQQFKARSDITLDRLSHLAAEEVEYLALTTSQKTYTRILLGRLLPRWPFGGKAGKR